ncbi:MAG: thioredoxin family protein [Tannerellaceae bacterium]|nr:thioredoxin family protein [Tannerellaceae bacterium]
MKVKACVLVVSAAIITMSAGTKESKSYEGVNPGDFAPRVKSLGNEEDLNFQNRSERYTLLNFWAAYDAESRARNVQLANEINKCYTGKIDVLSISMDENAVIFQETVRIDGLDASTQLHGALTNQSELYRKYKLDNGFGSFLINDKGVIVAKDLTPDKLAKVMSLN